MKKMSPAARSVTVGVRLDPRLRYLVELAARKQRRSVSTFIDSALRDSLKRMSLVEDGPSLAEEAASLWDVDAAVRFARLAEAHPDLLTYDEQVEWKRQAAVVADKSKRDRAHIPATARLRSVDR
jgi:hypothetical protein